MAFWMYILQCADGSYYVGHSDNLEERFQRHQSGTLGGYTKTRRPVRLAYSEEFPTRDQAFAAEQQIKGWTRKKKEALIRGLGRATAPGTWSPTGFRSPFDRLRVSGVNTSPYL